MNAAPPLSVRNPRTGKIDREITPPGAAEVAAICSQLRAAQRAWGATTLEHRIEVMRAWADKLRAYKPRLVEADSTDTGYGQISKVAPDMVIGSIMRHCSIAPGIFAQAAHAGVSPGAPNISFATLLKPYPVAGIIGPWNAPLMLSTLHAIPALFAGCAVLVKPSEVAPRFVEPIMQCIGEIPELAAVLRYIVGDGQTGAAIVDNVDIVNFTGSVPNGRKVAEACARRFIPCMLELGGKDPVVITQTADLDRAASAVLRGAVTSTGQVCFSIERVYVHESVHDEFVERLAAKAEQVQFKIPDDPDFEIKALVDFIGVIPAKSSITIPISIRAREDSPSIAAAMTAASNNVLPAGANGADMPITPQGWGNTFAKCLGISIDYTYECRNGKKRESPGLVVTLS